MAQDGHVLKDDRNAVSLAREDAKPSAFAQLAIAQAENARLRGWVIQFSSLHGDNSLAEALARKVRSMARRALEGEAV